MSDQTTPLLGTLSIDLGNRASKLSLSWHDDAGNLQLRRIPFAGDFGHPNRPRAYVESVFEFVAYAGLDEEGRDVVGGAALDLDVNFPIKTALLYRAVGKKSAIEKAPGSPDLLHAIESRGITKKRIDGILRNHLDYLRSIGLEHAAGHHVTITKISLSYACYICPNEGHNYFDLLMTQYLKAAKSVFGEDLRYETCSEGQGTACYICLPYHDPLRGPGRALIKNLFPSVVWGRSVVLVIADGGSSSLNIQMVWVALDEEGNMDKSQSIVIDGLPTGVQGGSDLVNSEMKTIIKEKLELPIEEGQIRSGDIAAYVQDFERQKLRLNYVDGTDDQLNIVLHSNEPARTPPVSVDVGTVKRCFHRAFKGGQRIIRIANECALELGCDFVVLYCGGTLSNPGYQSMIKSDMTRLMTRAEEKDITVRYTFLGEVETHFWSTAQSAGAALAVQCMPSPFEVLKGSAIGIQQQSAPDSPECMWVGEDLAGFLVCEECEDPEPSDHKIPPSPQARQKLRLALVCDPKYCEKSANRGTEAEAPYYPPISVNRPKEILAGPHWTYDLGWTVPAEQLPAGNVLVTISGGFIDRFAAGTASGEDETADGLDFVLSCFKVKANRGRKTRSRDPLDKKWHLSLRTDASSGYLVVRTVRQLPFWCDHCREEINGVARVCADCDDYSVCRVCHMRNGHHEGHEVESVRVDV